MTASLTELRSRVDASDMYGRIESLPAQLRDARAIGEAFAAGLEASAADVRQVVVCGMGGSAIAGDMARSFLGDRLRVPLINCRDYRVPAGIRDGSLVIFSSYSGNTGETLSAYEGLRGGKSRFVAITSGGDISRRAADDAIPVCRIPGGMPPRTAIGYSLLPLLFVLRALGLADFEDSEVDDAVAACTARVAGCAVGIAENPAAAVARRLQGRLPVIYAAPGLLEGVARRWAGQIGENAKSLAHFALYPELNHNEIVGWDVGAELLARTAVVSLEDSGDHPMTRRQTEVSLGIIGERTGDVIRLQTAENGRLSRMLSMMILGDFVSLYLAYLNGVDPTPVEKIDYLKARLKD